MQAQQHNSLDAKRPLKGRFAPSPTGRMHAGNVYAALLTWLMCKSTGGSIVLRIEDLDRDRSRQEFIDWVMRDFEALGLTWDEGPYFQKDRDEAYAEAFRQLQRQGLVYPCFCSRADLKAASAPHSSDHWVYPGTCKGLAGHALEQRYEQLAVEGRIGPSQRLAVPNKSSIWSIEDTLQGHFEEDLATEIGDFIIQRADGAFAYQLAVVVDDAAQGITFVSRGIDLLPSSPQQLYLQDLLGLPHAQYAHFPLFNAKDGRRLAKRDKDAAIDQLIQAYKTPEGVIGHIAHIAGLTPFDEPVTPDELLADFSIANAVGLYRGVSGITYR